MRTGAEFFTEPSGSAQRRYEAMRAYFVDEWPAAQVADQFGYSTASVHQMATLVRSGRMRLFTDARPGPKGPTKATGPVREKVLALRQRRLPVTEIARILARELHDEFGEIGLVRGDPLGRESLVQADLLRGHRLDLDHLIPPSRPDQPGDDGVRLRGVLRPVDVAAGPSDLRLESQEVGVKVGERMILDRLGRGPELLPVAQLGDRAGPLGPDDAGRVREVAAELSIRHGHRRGLSADFHAASSTLG